MNIATGEGPLWVAVTCLIGVIIPAIGGFWLWRSSLTHFDRLVGRPFKTSTAAAERFAIVPASAT
jgi:hypothetical protein